MLQAIDLCDTNEWFTAYKAMVYAFEMTCFSYLNHPFTNRGATNARPTK